MFTIINKIRKSLAINGFVGTLKQSLNYLKRHLFHSKSNNDPVDLSVKRDLEFDEVWGVDTKGTSVPPESDVVGGNWVYGNKYQGCDPEIFSDMMKDLKINYGEFTFIDIGSGKGRALLLASMLPFKKVVGVEFSDQLCSIANQNIGIFPDKEKQCQDIEVICTDALQYQLPNSDLVIFLYNPFGRQIMEKVAENVAKSYSSNPRKIIVVYMTAYFADIWSKFSYLKQSRFDWIAIFESDKN